jgi:hypothetical protein
MCNPEQEIRNLGSAIDDYVLQPIKEDPVEAIATAVGFYYGGPEGAALARGGTKLAQGEEPEDAAKAAVITYVTATAGQELGASTGGGGETGAFDSGQGLDAMSGGSGQVAGTAGSTVAPITDATVVTPEQTYPGVEQNAFTPAPGSLQAELPSLGVETAASSAPYTAIPGSIEAQLAGTPIAGANPSISVQDAFRGARMIQGLLNRPQQPQTNPYALMNQQQQPGLVSYEELLGLLNRPMASTPNVYQTLASSQNPYSLI